MYDKKKKHKHNKHDLQRKQQLKQQHNKQKQQQESMQQQRGPGRETNAYVVHAGLSNITAEEIAALTLACVNSWPQIESASYFRCVPQTEIFALGWTWRGFSDAPAPLIPAGTQLQVLRVAREHPFPCVVVRRLADPFRGNAVVPLSFLVPFCVHVLQTSGRAPGVD